MRSMRMKVFQKIIPLVPWGTTNGHISKFVFIFIK